MPKDNETNTQPITPEAYEALKGELAAAQAAVTKAVEQASQPLKERIASLEAEAGNKTRDIAALKGQVAEKDKSFASLSASFEGALTAYTGAVLKANPLVPPELVAGATVAEVDASVQKASAIVGKIKEGLAQQTQQVTVPPGAPGRTPPDTSTLSAREKITHGLNAKRKGG